MSIVITLFLVLKIIQLLFFKPNYGILSCGLFGFSGIEGKKPNWKKVEILGIYNTERGTDSCGYYFKGNIAKGVKDTANFSRFVVYEGLVPGELKNNIFLGHTRKATGGAHTPDNAHPFVVNNLVLTHNGTIGNAYSMAVTEHKFGFNQYDVDSHALALVIDKIGFVALEQYKGFAALAMTYTDDPESLYLYHGAVRKSTDLKLHEERPLFILRQPEGIYYSSIKESLMNINDNKKKYEVEMVPHNKVLRITNGILTDYEYKVNREEIDMPVIKKEEPKVTTIHAITNNRPPASLPAPKQTTIHYPGSMNVVGPTSNSVLEETMPKEAANDGHVFYWKGRHWVKDGPNWNLASGVMKIERNGKIVEKRVIEKFHEADIYFFIRGVMIDTKKKYDQALLALTDINSNFKGNTAYHLSTFSRYAVCCLPDEGIQLRKDLKLTWWKKHERFTGAMDVKFSSRRYTISEGSFVKLERLQGDSPALVCPMNVVPKETQEKPDLKPATWLDSLIDSMHTYCCKDLSEIGELSIKENFLEFIDFYNREITSVNIEDHIIEKRTAFLVRYLISQKQSFYDFLQSTDQPKFANRENLKRCFYDYEPNDVVITSNRYSIVSLYDPRREDDSEFVMRLGKQKDDEVVPATTDCCVITPKVTNYEDLTNDDAPFDTTVDETKTNGYVPLLDKADAIFETVGRGMNYDAVERDSEAVLEYLDDLRMTASNLMDSGHDTMRKMGNSVLRAIDQLRPEVENRIEQFHDETTPNN